MADPSNAQQEAAATESAERLRALSEHRDKKVRVAVALNPAAPLELLAKLVTDKHHLVRFAVAERADRGAWHVALSADDAGVRMVLAQRRDLDEGTMEALIADPDREVRGSVAESTTRPDVLARLARDSDHRVRASAATNPAIDDEDIELLAADRVARVRAVAAQNRRLSPDTVTRLAGDRSGNVRYFTLETHRDRLDLAEALKDDEQRDIAELARRLLPARPR